MGIAVRALVLVTSLVSFAILTSIPLSSAAAPAATSSKHPKYAPPPPSQPTLPPDVAIGRRAPSSAVFPLYGDVYPHGLYYVSMSIGDPPKPYFLDVDTGSDLTWVQCDAPCVSCSIGPHPWYRPGRNNLVACQDPLCVALQRATSGYQSCYGTQQCDYEIQYADHGSSLGVLVSDAFALRLTNTSVVRPSLAFGCGYDQQFTNSKSPSPTDGMLGLGSGKTSMISQLKEQGITRNVVGHCLSSKGGGFLFFGDDLVPYTKVTWAPMSRSALKNYYSPGQASLYFGTQSLGVKQMEVVIDSGSSYTYFGFQPYQALLSALQTDLAKKPLKETLDDSSLPLCWRGRRPFKSLLDVKKYFKTLILSFVNGKRAFLEIPPENYLIITKYGNACLGILNGTQVGLNDLNVIGDISMQDLMVVYDNEKEQIGWIRAACDRLPNAEANGGGFEGGFCQPQFASLGVHTEVCPAY
ncbi:aspartic proteinase Asp1-like [Typha angustifolia]|uniref:aspartic proteinase Asp1-like n=1 Tax=Typha angustifolia TaxID=59011 RepID=UPI003C2D0DF1